MKHTHILNQFFLALLITLTHAIKGDIVKHVTKTAAGDELYGIISSVQDCSYIALQKCSSDQSNHKLFIVKIPYRIELLIWQIFSDELLIGYFNDEEDIVALVFDSEDHFKMLSVNTYPTRSCFEYANPITRTFDQLNIKRCMRVGGDLIVCGKIINDPICNVTPCATQVER